MILPLQLFTSMPLMKNESWQGLPELSGGDTQEHNCVVNRNNSAALQDGCAVASVYGIKLRSVSDGRGSLPG